ncbi:unnamed protein product [Victoria cruziana]
MASDQAAGGSCPTAQVVGNAFVHQYYHILHQSPDLVFRFYQDSSKLGRPDEGGGMSIVTTTQEINEKILSMDYSDFMAEIKTVDAQDSLDGGVPVLVTGDLISKDNVKKNFTQSFFLAPQDRGYYVLNDIFRFVEELGHPMLNNGVRNIVNKQVHEELPIPEQEPVQENHVVDQAAHSSKEDHDDPLDDEEGSVVNEGVVDENSSGLQHEIDSTSAVEEAPKKSYASIQQGFCFGFVEFESSSAVQSSIEASPLTIGGRQAYVEEKKPSGCRVARGRFPNGRGGFRNDGSRGGRGNYGAGRGYGKGDFNYRSDFLNRTGRGGSSNRGGENGYHRLEHAGHGGSRVHRMLVA